MDAIIQNVNKTKGWTDQMVYTKQLLLSQDYEDGTVKQHT